MSRRSTMGVTTARERFRAAATKCKQEVAGLPKGQKLQAYRACMSRELRKR